ncbi:MAG: carbon-nitrogen hydrolase family protein [Bacteroidota bacterium]
MKICLAQFRPAKGAINQNIERHQRVLTTAIRSGADLIIFPELSITGYEPTLAGQLACTVEDDRFTPFQTIADNAGVTIGVGMPTKAANGVHISMLFFQPHRERSYYAKQRLHPDEIPYFVGGKQPPFLLELEKKVAFGICYETLQRAHFVHAAANGADLFIASVAKPDRGVDKAYVHFPTMAQEFNLPILMVNSVGPSDDFVSNGKSAVWDTVGTQVAQLDDKNEGLLLYDTERAITTIVSLTDWL